MGYQPTTISGSPTKTAMLAVPTGIATTRKVLVRYPVGVKEARLSAFENAPAEKPPPTTTQVLPKPFTTNGMLDKITNNVKDDKAATTIAANVAAKVMSPDLDRQATEDILKLGEAAYDHV